MVREPDATRQPTPHDIQLMSKHRVLSFKPQLRLEWRGQDGQNETEQPDHSASLGDSITASTRIRFSVHTPVRIGAIDPDVPHRHHDAIEFPDGSNVLVTQLAEGQRVTVLQLPVVHQVTRTPEDPGGRTP
jgi:hypothetical protein